MKIIILLLCTFCLSHCAMASQDREEISNPVLVGSVSDAFSKKPVKGVTISVKSSADKTAKSVTTDAEGRFIIPWLPAGEVTIVLEKKGYKTYRREKIVVKEGSQVKLNFDMSEKEETGNLFHPLMRILES